MVIAKIYVDGVAAHVTELQKIPKGIAGAVIEVKYATNWDGLMKTAVFTGAVTRDVLNADGTVTIPAAVVAESIHRVKVGFYGVDGDKNLIVPTLWADLGIVQDAADPSGDPGTDPELPVWAQLQQEVEELKESGGLIGPEGPQGIPGDDYVLTDADKTEIAEMAAGLVKVPEVSIKPLTFTGAVNATYDGSKEVTVEIPQGGGGENWEYIGEFNVGEEDVEEWIITEDENGKPIELRKMYVSMTLEPSEATTGNTALLLGNPGYKTPFATNIAIVSLGAAIRTSRNTNGGTFYYCPNGEKSEVIYRYSSSTYNVSWSRGRANKVEDIIKPCLAGIAMKTANATTGLIGAGSTIRIWGVRI